VVIGAQAVLLVILGIKLALRPTVAVVKVVPNIIPSTQYSVAISVDPAALTKILRAQFGTTEPSTRQSPRIAVESTVNLVKLQQLTDPLLNLHPTTRPATNTALTKAGITVLGRRVTEIRGDGSVKTMKSYPTMPTTEP
jgi:hypothetical protein